jgi:pilus assembly protein CpaE
VAPEKSLVIIDSDEPTRALFTTIGNALPGGRVAAESADFALGMKLARQVRPAILVVEIVPDEERLKAIERFHLEYPGTAILATSKDASTETVLKCVRSGAQEFLPRPVDSDEARKAVDRLMRVSAGAMAAGGKIIAVFSNKGGTGTSTLAVNLAVSLAQVTGQGVALADFDNQAGEVSLFLNLRPTRTIADLASGQGKLDSAVVQSALVKHPSGVYVLCEPERPEQTEGITGPRVHEILGQLTSSFPYVVCDLSHSFNDVSLEVFDSARHILVVTLLNLPAIRSARRCLDVFRQLNYLRDEEKVRLVINRYLPNRDIDVSQLEETLRYSVSWRIPNDYATVIDAVNSGLPVHEVNPDSEVARSFRALASELAGVEIETENSRASGGLFGKLLGRKR